MKRRVIILSAITLAVMLFMLIPAQTAPQYGSEVKILKITKVLPMNGRKKTVTFAPTSDATILEIVIDNTPTGPGLESDHMLMFFKVGGSQLHPGWLPGEIAQYDQLAMRPLFGLARGEFARFLPVAAGEKVKMGFNTYNGVNDVVIEVTVCYIGGEASLY